MDGWVVGVPPAVSGFTLTPIRSDLSPAGEPFSACSREFLLRTDLN